MLPATKPLMNTKDKARAPAQDEVQRGRHRLTLIGDTIAKLEHQRIARPTNADQFLRAKTHFAIVRASGTATT